MARLITRIFGRKETKEANERPDQPGRLSEAILAAAEERSQLRATIERVAQDAERRDQRIRADARAAAAELKLGRPGERRREAPDSEKSVAERHAAAMQRGLARIGKLTATFRFDLDEGALKSLAARAVEGKKPDGASGRHEERGTTDLEGPAFGQSEALEGRGESRGGAGQFQLPLAELGKLLQARFGNLDLINKTIPGSVDSSSGAPLDWCPREQKPDGEGGTNKAVGVSSDVTKPEGALNLDESERSVPAAAPGSDKGDGKERS